jgi:hypothetical protein
MSSIFCIQDRTGTAAQLTLVDPVANPIEIGDTGLYSGFSWNGKPVSLPFVVGQILDDERFGITVGQVGTVMQSKWPENGVVKWETGDNFTSPNTYLVEDMVTANAYIDTKFFYTYFLSRGISVSSIAEDILQGAIVQATDYLDQYYRYKGIKLLQFVSNSNFDPFSAYIDPWLAPFGFAQTAIYVPSTTQQHTEWPRQGVVDANGDNVYGIPKQIEFAASELAYRVLNGTVLQPDYNTNVVTPGAIIASITTDVGPIKKTISYDTKLGIGFFVDYPHITRMLSRAGLLVASSGRSVIR